MSPEATPDDYHESLLAVVNIVVGVVSTTAPDVRAILRRRPIETAGPVVIQPGDTVTVTIYETTYSAEDDPVSSYFANAGAAHHC